jgi:hypothetical protein
LTDQQQLRAVYRAEGGALEIEAATRANAPVAVFLLEVGCGDVGMAQRG